MCVYNVVVIAGHPSNVLNTYSILIAKFLERSITIAVWSLEGG